jgi:cardiolipin synthase (CMP-forming)
VIRPSAKSLTGTAIFLVADVTWLELARPPRIELLLTWFGLLWVAGALVPGAANQVTLVRAHLAGPALVYSISPSKLLHLAAVVTLAGVTDLVDGAVARRFERPSRLGGALDPVVDGVFFGAVAIGLVIGVSYPLWLAGLVVLRYALPAMAGGLLLLAGRRPVLRHTPLGQASTMLIGIFLGGAALLHGLGASSGGLLLTVAEVGIPLAVLGTFANLFWANRRAVLGHR